MSSNQILQGVRILAFTTGYAGPYAGRLLASYGAEVIKIESKKGGLDTFRHYQDLRDKLGKVFKQLAAPSIPR